MVSLPLPATMTSSPAGSVDDFTVHGADPGRRYTEARRWRAELHVQVHQPVGGRKAVDLDAVRGAAVDREHRSNCGCRSPLSSSSAMGVSEVSVLPV